MSPPGNVRIKNLRHSENPVEIEIYELIKDFAGAIFFTIDPEIVCQDQALLKTEHVGLADFRYHPVAGPGVDRAVDRGDLESGDGGG